MELSKGVVPSDDELLKMVQNNEAEALRQVLLGQSDSSLVNTVRDWVRCVNNYTYIHTFVYRHSFINVCRVRPEMDC